MIKNVKLFSLITLGLSLALVSCRSEESSFMQGPVEENLAPDTKVSELLKNTASKDGSIDNIIDNASCTTVQLPVTVIANGNEIIVNTTDDLVNIEMVFDESDTDEDILDIIYPIRIIFSDYSEITVNNSQELENFTSDCPGENEEDDDIECIDILYPITASVFNTTTEALGTVTFNNDRDFYLFLNQLNESVIVKINFPVTLVLYDGTEIKVKNMKELEDNLDNASDSCDEDDDNDYNDDDCDNCNTEQLTQLMTGCTDWRLNRLNRNDIDNNQLYTGYRFNFNADGSLTAVSPQQSFTGTWETNGSGYDIAVIINIPGLPDLSGNWNLKEYHISDSKADFELRMDDDRARFQSNCQGN